MTFTHTAHIIIDYLKIPIGKHHYNSIEQLEVLLVSLSSKKLFLEVFVTNNFKTISKGK